MCRKLAGAIVLLMSVGMVHTSLQATDRILAIVNKDTITQSEADIYLNMVILQLSQQYKGKALEDQIADEKEQLVDRMIEDKIILQEARRKGLRARPDKVKQRVEQIKAGYDSEIDFESSLKERGLTVKDLEDKLSDQMIMREVVDMEIREKTIVGPDEVTKFYEARKSEFMQTQARTIESLFMGEKTELEKLTEELKNNTDFQSLAQKYNGLYAKDTVSKEQLRPEVQEQIFSLHVNEITPPIPNEKGIYFFKLLEVHEPKLLSLSEVHERIFNYLFEEKFTLKMLEWLDDLKAKAYIEIKS